MNPKREQVVTLVEWELSPAEFVRFSLMTKKFNDDHDESEHDSLSAITIIYAYDISVEFIVKQWLFEDFLDVCKQEVFDK